MGSSRETPWALSLFSIVLQSILISFAEDAQCNSLDFNCLYMDNGVLAGDTAALVKAEHLLDTYGTTKGLLLNPFKCQLFGHVIQHVFIVPYSPSVSRPFLSH